MSCTESDLITDGDQVILKKEKSVKLFQIRKNRPVWVDKMKFGLSGAIGYPYGTTFEVKDGNVVKFVNKPLEGSLTTGSEEGASGQDNRSLLDTDANQKLSRDDILALKEKGIRGEDLVGHIIENSATFKNKTEFSQQKYIKKKKKKHLPFYTILKPTTRLLFEMYYNRGPSKICYMRLDTLSQLLSQANVHSNSKIMVVETCQGLVLGAVMERMGGTGTVLQLYSGTSPVRQALEGYSFPKEFYDTLHAYPLDHVNQLQIRKINGNIGEKKSSDKDRDDIEMQEDKGCTDNKAKNVTSTTSINICPSEISASDSVNVHIKDTESKDPQNASVVGDTSVQESGEHEQATSCSQKQKNDSDETEGQSSHKKQKTENFDERAKRRDMREKQQQEAKEIIENADMDGLIVATKFHPTAIVLRLLEFMSFSRPLVVYCQYKEPLVDCYMKLRQRGGVINLKITETWFREYQILPQRTHPQINMSGTGGFLLSGLYVER